jgi:hypothetical protein
MGVNADVRLETGVWPKLYSIIESCKTIDQCNTLSEWLFDLNKKRVMSWVERDMFISHLTFKTRNIYKGEDSGTNQDGAQRDQGPH